MGAKQAFRSRMCALSEKALDFPTLPSIGPCTRCRLAVSFCSARRCRTELALVGRRAAGGNTKDSIMAKVRLTELQVALLASGEKREAGSILPLSDQLSDRAKMPTKAITQLLKRGLISETATREDAEAGRTEGNRKYGLMITASGRAAIGGDDTSTFKLDDVEQPKLQPTCAGYTANLPPLTKTKIVIDLLWRDQGATIGELIAATGWLPHTTRAALTGLRKKGHIISKGKRDDATCYTIVGSEA